MDVERTVRVAVNVYDVIEPKTNDKIYWLGLGAFHSGLVLNIDHVMAAEYGFGAHPFPTSGVFVVEPGKAEGCIFRVRVDMGEVKLSLNQIREVLSELAAAFTGCSYDLLNRNCNHFTSELALRLTGRDIPGWINRLGGVIESVKCCIPTKYFPKGPSAEGIAIPQPQVADEDVSLDDSPRQSPREAKKLVSDGTK
eukprot:TRINITY_DN6127_c0_g2_i1.p1 TRINITY_DN6127_c0_g2~~TRINITY_DN6127_c0_g2_i1.p1  ORF type:complete len:214 (-),score=32.78 TRINITY_DN6127_c0_g2_i1:142-729(-)